MGAMVIDMNETPASPSFRLKPLLELTEGWWFTLVTKWPGVSWEDRHASLRAVLVPFWGLSCSQKGGMRGVGRTGLRPGSMKERLSRRPVEALTHSRLVNLGA